MVLRRLGGSINAECVAKLQESFKSRTDIAAVPVGVLWDEIVQRLGARVQIVIDKEVVVPEGINRELPIGTSQLPTGYQ